MLHVHDALDLYVIIMDSKAQEYIYTFSVPRDHPIVELWPKKLRDPVLELVESVSWLSIGVNSWGIVIIVKNKKQAPWDELTWEIL